VEVDSGACDLVQLVPSDLGIRSSVSSLYAGCHDVLTGPVHDLCTDPMAGRDARGGLRPMPPPKQRRAARAAHGRLLLAVFFAAVFFAAAPLATACRGATGGGVRERAAKLGPGPLARFGADEGKDWVSSKTSPVGPARPRNTLPARTEQRDRTMPRWTRQPRPIGVSIAGVRLWWWGMAPSRCPTTTVPTSIDERFGRPRGGMVAQSRWRSRRSGAVDSSCFGTSRGRSHPCGRSQATRWQRSTRSPAAAAITTS